MCGIGLVMSPFTEIIFASWKENPGYIYFKNIQCPARDTIAFRHSASPSLFTNKFFGDLRCDRRPTLQRNIPFSTVEGIDILPHDTRGNLKNKIKFRIIPNGTFS
jgi:hypothetical protein